MITSAEVNRLFDGLRAQRRAMRRTTAAERIERLERLRVEILTRQVEIAEAIHADLGRPLEDRSEVNTVMANIDKVRDELADWMKPQPVEKSPTTPAAERVFVQYEPRGVMVIFGTWDFPLAMLFSPLIQAVAAGNVVLTKPNPVTPASAEVVEQIVRAAFDEREVAVVNTDDIDTPDGVADANDFLLDLPFDHIFLTGSPRVGRIIVGKAAQHLASFTLELGGKSPAIIDRTADLDQVAESFVPGKVYNHGQNCLAVDHVWVPEDLRDTLIEKYVTAVKKAYYDGETFQWQRDGRFVNKRNYDRVKGYLDEAIERGATVAFGGRADPDNLVIEPTVLIDVPVDTQVIQEELFAPILPFLTYTDEEQIWAHSDTLGKPLGLAIYSEDRAFIDRVLDNTTSGGVTINGSNLHWAEENLPFGGTNSSGYGRYHGIWGFRELSNARAVFHAVAGG